MTLPMADAARALAQGHLVVFPTETVYGLGADGLNPKASARIFEVKGRPADHPVILHVADIALARSLASEWPDAADKLAQAFWPGPLTLILKRSACVPDMVTGGQDTVGIRMPSHPMALKLLNEFATVGSGVIAAPSANRFGAVSPTRARDVMADIGDRLSAHDMVIDGGDCDVGVESTIVDLSSGAPRILRPGGISRQAIAACLGMKAADLSALGVTHSGADVSSQSTSHHMDDDPSLPRVSGSLESHYAPHAHVMLEVSDEMQTKARAYRAAHPHHKLACLVRTGTLLDAEMLAAEARANDARGQGATIIRMPMDARTYAHELYARLHDLDAQGFDALLIEMPPADDAWEAVRDRLKRAAA